MVVLQVRAAAKSDGAVVLSGWAAAASPSATGWEEPAGPWPPPCPSACLSFAIQDVQIQGHNGVCIMNLLPCVNPPKPPALYFSLKLPFFYAVPLNLPVLGYPH